MTHLLDTNTCVQILRDATGTVSHRLHAHAPTDIVLCPIVVQELYYGAFRSARPTHNLAGTRRFISTFRCLPFDDKTAETCGRLRADLAAKGTPIGWNDAMIAATALTHGLTLVTHNTREFSRVPGLVIEDWQ